MDLKQLRVRIDRLDDQLLKLLHQRKGLVAKVGIFKKKQGLPVFNKAREIEIAKKLEKFAVRHGLRKTYLQKLWATIIEEARVIEKKLKK